MSAERAQLIGQRARAVFRTGDGNRDAVQRRVTEPVKRIRQRTHRADNQNRRTGDVLLLHTAGQRADGCHQLALCGQRAALNHRRRHILRHARLHETGQNHRRAADAHQKHQRAAMAHKRFKI